MNRSLLKTLFRVSIVLSALALVVMFLGPAGSVQAKQLAGTVTIDEGGNYGWRMDIAIPSQVEFEIHVLNGTTVDVLVLDQDNYTRYAANSTFGFFEEYSALGTSNVSMNITVLSGTLYLIIDNSGLPAIDGAATPGGEAEVHFWVASSFDLHAIPSEGAPWIAYILIGVFAVSLVAVVFMTRKAIRQRKTALGKIE